MPALIALMGAFLMSSALPAHAGAPDVAPKPGFTVTVTGYNAVPSQTDSDPFITASGAYANPEVVIARSRDLGDTLPFGTIIELDAPKNPNNACGFQAAQSLIGYRVVADTMNQRYTDRLDVLFPTAKNVKVGERHMNGANALGECAGVTARIVGYVDLTHTGNLPKTQAELVQLLSTSSLAVK